MCQKEQETEEPKSWLLILIFAISSMGGLTGLSFLNRDLIEPNEQVSRRSKSTQVALQTGPKPQCL